MSAPGGGCWILTVHIIKEVKTLPADWTRVCNQQPGGSIPPANYYAGKGERCVKDRWCPAAGSAANTGTGSRLKGSLSVLF